MLKERTKTGRIIYEIGFGQIELEMARKVLVLEVGDYWVNTETREERCDSGEECISRGMHLGLRSWKDKSTTENQTNVSSP